MASHVAKEKFDARNIHTRSQNAIAFRFLLGCGILLTRKAKHARNT